MPHICPTLADVGRLRLPANYQNFTLTPNCTWRGEKVKLLLPFVFVPNTALQVLPVPQKVMAGAAVVPPSR